MTYSVDIYNAKGKVIDAVELNQLIFSDEKINKDLIHEYYLLQQANARLPIAHTKTRSEVQWSGRKLFKQKGTGNARPGDLRSPIRRKWGVAFGPRSERSYTKSMTKKARKLALNGLLTIKAQNSALFGLDAFGLTQIRTKDALATLAAIGLSGKKILVVLSEKDAIVEKSLRNLDWVKYIYVNYLNPSDLLYYDTVLLLKPALDIINTVS